MGPELTRRADALSAERVPFVVATVVRAQRPTSVRAGDSAIVLGDGTIEGFVGGACAETSVRLHALRVLETGEPLLLKIVPEGGEAATEEGAVVERNPCLSGGALELFLEPRVPAPRIAVVGETPIGFALARVGEEVGFDVEVGASGPELGDQVALVVASHGREEDAALAAALTARVPYVGLVASRRRGEAVIESLRQAGVGEEDLGRLHTPAGLAIGAETPAEIALSILAEIVAERQSPRAEEAATAVDPVCGMTVAISAATPSADLDGRRFWFCGDGCREAFEADPSRYAAGAR
ncbi:MAG TPA: XdhC family protein [Thermoleophilaceae bacterium]